MQKALANDPLAVFQGGSSSFAALVPLLRQTSTVPFFTMSATDAALYPTPVPNVFMSQASASQQAHALVAHLKTVLGGSLDGKKVGFLGLSSPYVDGLLKTLESDLSAAGASIGDNERFPLTVTSYSSQAAKIAGAQPDAVIFIGTSSGTAPGVKALSDAGLTKIPLLSYSSGASIATVKAIAAPNYSALRTATEPETGTAIRQKAKDLGYESNASSNYFSLGWSDGAIVASTLKTCGDGCDSSKLLKALQEISSFEIPAEALFGPVTISSTKHAVFTQGQFYKLEAGTVVKDGDPVSLEN